MSKYLNVDVKVVVGTADLSDHAFRVDTPSEKEQVDVSGFSPNGTREFLPGLADQTITIGFLQDFGSGSVHSVLEPLYTSGSTFPIFVQPDSDAGTSTTNPIYGGSATLYSYNGLNGELNARGEVEGVFKPAPNSLFSWGTVAP
jgi:hypothetical protein